MLNMVVLGLVQGFTEFLPVSSTAHLLFAEALLGIRRPGILLEAVLHLGTAAAAAILFWGDVRRLVAGWVLSVQRRSDPALVAYGRVAWVIILITAIAAALGLAFRDPLERMFSSVRGTAVQLMATGLILLVARERSGRAWTDATAADGVTVGLAQAASIIPGLSRSGTTIAAALWRGMRRDDAARLSFLAAIPAVAGAGLVGLADLSLGEAMGYTPAQLLVGFAVSLASGAAAIRWLLWAVRRGQLRYFGIYCVAAGAVVLVIGGGR